MFSDWLTDQLTALLNKRSSITKHGCCQECHILSWISLHVLHIWLDLFSPCDPSSSPLISSHLLCFWFNPKAARGATARKERNRDLTPITWSFIKKGGKKNPHFPQDPRSCFFSPLSPPPQNPTQRSSPSLKILSFIPLTPTDFLFSQPTSHRSKSWCNNPPPPNNSKLKESRVQWPGTPENMQMKNRNVQNSWECNVQMGAHKKMAGNGGGMWVVGVGTWGASSSSSQEEAQQTINPHKVVPMTEERILQRLKIWGNGYVPIPGMQQLLWIWWRNLMPSSVSDARALLHFAISLSLSLLCLSLSS